MSSLIISSHLYEKRPLKKPKLGPPDVYPQEKNQKEVFSWQKANIVS